MNKKIISIVIILAIVVFITYQTIFKEKGPDFTLAEVIRGSVSQEVSETGQVQMGDSIKLGFKNAGTIAAIMVKVGDQVWPGTNLVRLNLSQLLIEKQEAQANLEIAQAKLNQLLAGATPEEIQAAQTDVENAQVALKDAQQDYLEDLSRAQEDAVNTIDNAYLKALGALNKVTSIRKTYFYGRNQESITVEDKESDIENLVVQIEESIDTAKNSLMDIYDDLSVIRDMTEVAAYADIVSATDKTALNTERLNINTALTNVIDAQQAIASAKITGETAVNAAQSNLKEAQDDLALILAGPSQADIDLHQAQVKQAKSQVDLSDNKIWEATLRSPVQGTVAKINKEIGESWQSSLTESVVTLLPVSPYEIKVDIYEEDIVKIDIGNDVDISLIAFPDKIFQGKVIAINPAEELIENVVYYTVTVNFAETPEGLRPGMTADVSIKTASKENVLVIPDDAIEKKDGQNIVRVFENNEIKEKKIEVGLLGAAGLIEVVSGLEGGEKVMVK